MEEAGDVSPPASPTSAGSIESASNPAYPTINPPQPASDPIYPPAYPQQKAGYPAMYPPAYPQQPMANSTYPLQPVGAQPFAAVTVVDQLKHSPGSIPLQPPNYLCFSIFNMLCCFVLLGLFAKQAGAWVTYEYKIGNYEKARKASRKALYLNLAAFFSGIALWIVVVVGAACYLFYNTFLRD